MMENESMKSERESFAGNANRITYILYTKLLLVRDGVGRVDAQM
jgi:hypothetical protein